MRSYPADSPDAMARIVVLALLADGAVDISEMTLIEKQQIIRRIGLDQQGFDRVMGEFSDDLQEDAWLDETKHLEIDNEKLDQLLNEIKQRPLQKKLLRLILEIIDADRLVDGGEAVLLTRAIEIWGIDLFEVSGSARDQRSTTAASYGTNR